jgi:hypothetical protein
VLLPDREPTAAVTGAGDLDDLPMHCDVVVYSIDDNLQTRALPLP